MSDRLFLALMAAAAVLMIGLAAVWPQGLGARSPWPFGHTPLQQTPAMQAVMEREAARAQMQHKARLDAAEAQLRRVTTPAPAPPPEPATPASKRLDAAGLRSDP